MSERVERFNDKLRVIQDRFNDMLKLTDEVADIFPSFLEAQISPIGMRKITLFVMEDLGTELKDIDRDIISSTIKYLAEDLRRQSNDKP